MDDGFAIEYDVILHECGEEDAEGVAAYLMEALPDEWCDAYRRMTPTPTNVFQVSDHGFQFLFDLACELVHKGEVAEEEAVEDRVVAAFGLSQAASHGRDASRMRGFLGGGLEPTEAGPTDKGHFIGHAQGGGLDINLFPQLRDVNRGWSERGKVYREMERYCAEHPGTFCFSRPIYADGSWRPTAIEYGVLTGPRTLWVERFEN